MKAKKPITDPRKCPKHNEWMRKGWCPKCDIEAERRQNEFEQITGYNKPKVIIKKI